MATRSGGGSSTALIGKLQEARASLEAHLGCPVASAVTDHGLVLYAYPPPPKKGRFGRPGAKTEVPATWEGFVVVDKGPPPHAAKQ